MRTTFGIVFSLLLLATWGLAQELPTYHGPVVDQGGLLTAPQIQQLEDKILAYRQKSTNEIGVLIVKSIGDRPLEDYANDVYKRWGIGQKGKDNGVLFLVVLDQKKARLEVGYGLEADLTDIEASRLVRKESPMANYFRQGDYYDGINAVVDGIIQAIGGEYNPAPVKSKDKGSQHIPGFIFLLFLFFFLVPALLRHRFWGGPWGGWGSGSFGGWGGGGGGGGGFSFGGGSSGGGGASGGW